MRRVLGWAALVGGGLAGAAATLLLLGPMLGFYAWSEQGPGPKSSGSLHLPAGLAQAARDRAAADRVTSPLGPLSPADGSVITVLAPGRSFVAQATTPRSGGALRPGAQSGSPGGLTPAPTSTQPQTPSAPAAPAPAVPATPAAPSAPQVAEAPAAVPAPVVQAPAQTAVSQPVVAPRPSNDSFSASSSVDERSERKAAREAEKAVRADEKAARTEERQSRRDHRRSARGRDGSDDSEDGRKAPVVEPVPVVEEAGDHGDEEEDRGRGWDRDRDEGRGWDRDRDDGQDDHDHDHGRGNDHDERHDRSARGWRD